MAIYVQITYNVIIWLYLFKLAQRILSKLEVGSMIQFGNPVKYGVIRRIETQVDTLEEIAEVETVSMAIICIIHI